MTWRGVAVAGMIAVTAPGCLTLTEGAVDRGPTLEIRNRGSSPVVVELPGRMRERIYPGQTVCARLPVGGSTFAAQVSGYAGDNRTAWTPTIDPRQSWTVTVGRTGVLSQDVLSLEPAPERCAGRR